MARRIGKPAKGTSTQTRVSTISGKPCKGCGSTTRKVSAPGPRCATCHRARRTQASLTRRLTYVAKQYNLTPEQYLSLQDRFGGLCWICRYRKGRQVDHDHACCKDKTSCGKCVRGLLCGPCNKFLGFIRDNVTTLQHGIDYLNQYKESRYGQ